MTWSASSRVGIEGFFFSVIAGLAVELGQSDGHVDQRMLPTLDTCEPEQVFGPVRPLFQPIDDRPGSPRFRFLKSPF